MPHGDPEKVAAQAGEDAIAPRIHLHPGQAVVVYARDRTADADMIGERLRALGFDVELQVEGPLSRERSSAAVYGLRTAETRLERVRDAISPLEDIELLPFAQTGPGDTDVVVWLVGRTGLGGPASPPDETAPDTGSKEAPAE